MGIPACSRGISDAGGRLVRFVLFFRSRRRKAQERNEQKVVYKKVYCDEQDGVANPKAQLNEK